MQAPTKLLADRYRFKQSLDLGAKSIAWIAVDEQTHREVVASALPTARVAALMGVVGLRHPNLAGIVDVVHEPEPGTIPGDARIQSAGIVVAELVRGTSLHQALKQKPCATRDAARWWLGLCEAVRSMHQSGGAHGAISPRSIVLEPTGGRAGPVLTQLLAPSSGAYCAPERLQGRGPSTADDVWALHASLFAAITASPPFKGESKDQLVLSMASGRIQQLSDYGLYEPTLQALLELGLTADLARRRSDVAELAQALEQWLTQSERTLAQPAPHVPDAGDWEEGAATVVQDDAQRLTALGLGSPRLPIAPMPSVPPVAVADVAPHEPDAGEDEESTTIMRQPSLEQVEAAVRAAELPERLPPPRLPPPPQPPPFAAPIQAATFDDEQTVIDTQGPPPTPLPSEPPTGILERDALPFPRAPRPASFDAPPPPAPAAPPAPVYAPPPATPISAFPPPISRPPPPGQDLAQLALSSDDEVVVRKAGRRPLLVLFGILILLGVGIGVAMYMNYRSAPVGRSETTPSPKAPATSPTEHRPSETLPGETPTSTADKPSGTGLPGSPPTTSPGGGVPSLAAAVGAATGANSGPKCVMALFEPGAFKDNEKFDFLCKGDFKAINSQLHRRLVTGGGGKVTPAMREWAELGWYELAATSVIRGTCCKAAEAAVVKLPRTPGTCPQLSETLAAIGKRPATFSMIPERSHELEKAVLCLFNTGSPRPYPYKTRPTEAQRKAFESFFRRTLERRPG